MGASSSRMDEDKALKLCCERKKFVKQALNGRCSLAVTHVTYIKSLEITGVALRRFVEPEAPIESSLYTSTSATPEPLAVTEKSHSQFSLSSPSFSQRVDATENLSPSPSPPSVRYQANHMKFRGTFSRKVEEKPSVPVVGSITSSSTPQNTTPRSNERPDTSPYEPLHPPTPPWDYFGLFNPIDDHFSSQEGRGMDQGLENGNDVRRVWEEEGIPDLEDEEESVSSPLRKESLESEDEFDEPPADTLVRSFENVNRASDHVATNGSFAMPSAESVVSETEFVDGEKRNSPDLSPLRATSLEVAVPTDVKSTPVKENDPENKVAPKDIFSSIKTVEDLFRKASESGIEVPKMLEANKYHFRPIFPGKESGSMTSTLLKACFSCGEDPSQVQEEPVQTTIKYLTWHRTTSSRSSSSRNPLCSNSKDEIEDNTSNLFDNFCMTSGSHASTLDRLYAWERKLHDEVKASEMVRKEYDMKCKLLRELESRGESSQKIDKTRAMVKDLHSRIGVAIHIIDSISKKIEELRDRELQPQLEELIEGLRRMWVVMFECHELQFRIISVAYNSGNAKISTQSEARRQITTHLEHELSALSTSFTKWIEAQKSYVLAINGWLLKCVTLQQKHSKRKRNRNLTPSLRHFGPPIYVTCGVWLDLLNTLQTKPVTDSIKVLAAEITRFLPHQEKNHGKGMNHTRSTSWQAGDNSDPMVNLLRDDASEDWITGFDRLRLSLVSFLSHLSNFAESSMLMFIELQKKIGEAKNNSERS